ncbi:hypothetical protein CsatB_025890 [Cannabis sativa]
MIVISTILHISGSPIRIRLFIGSSTWPFPCRTASGKVSITFQENALFQRDCKWALTLFANHLGKGSL